MYIIPLHLIPLQVIIQAVYAPAMVVSISGHREGVCIHMLQDLNRKSSDLLRDYVLVSKLHNDYQFLVLILRHYNLISLVDKTFFLTDPLTPLHILHSAYEEQVFLTSLHSLIDVNNSTSSIATKPTNDWFALVLILLQSIL